MGQGFISRHILEDIADFIRARKNTTDKIAPVNMRAELDSIPTYEKGKQEVYDSFWDSYQENGNRTNYSKGFCGCGWTDQTFNPKYDFTPDNCDEMFRAAAIVDIVGILKRNGVTLDTSNAILFSHAFSNTAIEEAPHLDLTKAGNIHYLFNGCYNLKKVSLTFAEGTISEYKYAFSGCSSLEDLDISGVIDIALSFINSPNLTTESVQSVVDALQDLTGSTAKTITFHAKVGAKMTDEQKATITAKNWSLVY